MCQGLSSLALGGKMSDPGNEVARCGPPSRAYVEVTSSDIEANAQKKNLLWILVHLHATENQTIPGWTGFNIKGCNEEQVSRDNIGYLQTIDTPASNMFIVFEVLSQSSVPGCWFERPVCRVPSHCRGVSVWSDGRMEIQPCRAATQDTRRV